MNGTALTLSRYCKGPMHEKQEKNWFFYDIGRILLMFETLDFDLDILKYWINFLLYGFIELMGRFYFYNIFQKVHNHLK